MWSCDQERELHNELNTVIMTVWSKMSWWIFPCKKRCWLSRGAAHTHSPQTHTSNTDVSLASYLYQARVTTTKVKNQQQLLRVSPVISSTCRTLCIQYHDELLTCRTGGFVATTTWESKHLESPWETKVPRIMINDPYIYSIWICIKFQQCYFGYPISMAFELKLLTNWKL